MPIILIKCINVTRDSYYQHTNINLYDFLLDMSDKDADKVYLSEFFDKLPKLTSQYPRSSSSKLYLETTVESLNHLFNLYIETCKSNNHSPLSRTVFRGMFHAKNLSLDPIKKDKGDLCTKHEVGQLSDEK